MGICYSQQQQWQAYKTSRKNKGRRRKQKTNSVIYEQKTVYDSSFASNVYNSFREDIHNTISQIAQQNGSVFMGSIVDMRDEELQILFKSLHKLSPHGQAHNLSEPIILCNLKTKNYLHTHKIKVPESRNLNEVSCCPFNSNHIPEYDIWKFIRADEQLVHDCTKEEIENQDEFINVYIYHPFTQRFLSFEKGCIVGSEQKKMWEVHSYGKRRNGGFVTISCPEGMLCMSEHKGLLQKHRKLQVCSDKHISHLWEVMFIDPQLE